MDILLLKINKEGYSGMVRRKKPSSLSPTLSTGGVLYF
jgi:hypothetical protein